MASYSSQIKAKLPLDQSLSQSKEISSEQQSNPNLLISGLNFLKGTDYSIAEFDEPLPVKRSKLRYFHDPPSLKKLKVPCESTKSSLEETIDHSQIVCLRCGEMGHVACGKETTEVVQIKWKPETDYREMCKKNKEAPKEEIKVKDNDDIEMNIACHLKTIMGNTIAKSNKSLVVDEKYKKYKMRAKRSKRVYCCKCGDQHKFSQCPLRCENYVYAPSDSDESIITNETSISEFKSSFPKAKNLQAFRQPMSKNEFKRFNKWNNARRKNQIAKQ